MDDNDLVFTVKIKSTTIIFLNVKLVFISIYIFKITKNVVKLKNLFSYGSYWFSYYSYYENNVIYIYLSIGCNNDILFSTVDIGRLEAKYL